MTDTRLKLKVCGMRDDFNISEVTALKPDYMGFIFYLKSPRFVGALPEYMIEYLKKNGVEPVAVFVDPSVATVLQMAELYSFTHVQLHGKESPEICAALKEYGLIVLKAFSMADFSDLEIVHDYEKCCDYFLFDTKTSIPGGSGCQFDWDILNRYSGSTPFFLSGGIGPGDAERITNFKHPMLYGIDVNSRFETQPALKDANLLKIFIDQLISKK